eukprot:5745752-Pyramimonas_sp.AAC.1
MKWPAGISVTAWELVRRALVMTRPPVFLSTPCANRGNGDRQYGRSGEGSCETQITAMGSKVARSVLADM